MDGQFGKVRDYLTAVLCCAAAVLLDQITNHLAVVHFIHDLEFVVIECVFFVGFI